MENTAKKTTSGIQSRVQTSAHIDTEISKIGVGGIAIVSSLIGLWSIACMVSGLVHSGGPLSFVKSWFGAVIG